MKESNTVVLEQLYLTTNRPMGKGGITMNSCLSADKIYTLRRYLRIMFGTFYVCPNVHCEFICPELNMIFRITASIEYPTGCSGKWGVLYPDLYKIIEIEHRSNDSHLISLRKYNEEKEWAEEFLKINTGSNENLIIDWRGIRPAYSSRIH